MSRIEDIGLGYHGVTRLTEASELALAVENSHILNESLLGIGSMLADRWEVYNRNLHIDMINQMGDYFANQRNLFESRSIAGNLEYIDGIRSMVENVDYLEKSGISKALKSFSNMLPDEGICSSAVLGSMTGIAKIAQNMGGSSVLSALYEGIPAFATAIERIIPDVDYDMLGRITEEVLSRRDDWDIESASEEIAREYVVKEEEAPAEQIEKAEPITRRRIDAKEVRAWILFFVEVIGFLLALRQAPAVVNNYSNTQVVNNYYVCGWGYKPEALNKEQYRIINRDAVVRRKHDCRSPVVAHLEEGEIVQIVSKYRKWRQIVWKDENDEISMGWVQNYKLTKFKRSRNRG